MIKSKLNISKSTGCLFYTIMSQMLCECVMIRYVVRKISKMIAALTEIYSLIEVMGHIHMIQLTNMT